MFVWPEVRDCVSREDSAGEGAEIMSGPESDVAQLPEDLPPVEPPSAGFIVQLFVVPGIIVAAIVAVWLLFGKLATTEHDWRSLVVELQHPNEHRRWRGALGLAQILKADQERGEAGQHLAQNRELAQTLSDVLMIELKSGTSVDEEFNYQAFLARTLGLFDLPETVAPALEKAMHGTTMFVGSLTSRSRRKRQCCLSGKKRVSPPVKSSLR